MSVRTGRSIVLAILLTGCSSLPTADSIPTEGAEWIETTAPGCEPPSAEAALRAAVGDDPERLAFARRVGAIETAIARKPIEAGNAVRLLVDGPATHAAQLDAIRQAKHHIHLEVFILTDEKLGQRYADALIERARAGVEVRLMYDGVGSLATSAEFREGMKQEGVQIEEVNSVNPLKEPRLWRRRARGPVRSPTARRWTPPPRGGASRRHLNLGRHDADRGPARSRTEKPTAWGRRRPLTSSQLVATASAGTLQTKAALRKAGAAITWNGVPEKSRAFPLS